MAVFRERNVHPFEAATRGLGALRDSCLSSCEGDQSFAEVPSLQADFLLTLFFKNMTRPVLFVPYGGETFMDLAQLLAAIRVVASLFRFIFGHNLFQESR